MKQSIQCLAVIVAVFFAGPALAGGGCQEGPHAAVAEIFESADRDGSGTLTPAEYADANLERFGVSFEATDVNADGETTLSEYLALYDVHHPSERGIEHPSERGIEL